MTGCFPSKEFKFLDSRSIVFEPDVLFQGARDLTEMDFVSREDTIKHLVDKFLLWAF